MRHPGLLVVVPVRGIAAGKSRLAPALDDDARAAFNAWLLERTLNTLDGWLNGLGACAVVSACERVREIAAARGAAVIAETPGGGLNGAAAAGVAYAARRGASTVLLLACDLPLLTAGALEAFVLDAARAEVIIAPDESGTGTNALIVPAGTPIDFAFGPGSFRKHAEAASARGFTVAVHRSVEIAFDVDTPADYARLVAAGVEPLAGPVI